MPDHLTRCLKARSHIGQAKLHGLMFKQRFVKALPVFGIDQCRVKGRARHTHRLRSDTDTTTFQTGQSDLVAHALVPNHLIGRHTAILENQLRSIGRMLTELFFDSRDDIAGCIRRYPEGTDTTLAGRLVGHCQHDSDIGIFTAGDKLLDPVEHITVAITRSGRT